MRGARMPSTASSSSSSNSEETPVLSPSKFLQSLRKTGRDLQLNFKEAPPSRPSSPHSKKRVEILTGRVREAYELAKGDTADGKWVHLAEMLRLGSTRPRYKRWAVDLKPEHARTEKGISPEKGEERKDLDSKIKGHKLKEKVENWKARIDTVSNAHLQGPSIPSSLLAVIDDPIEEKISDSRAEPEKQRGSAKVKRERGKISDSQGVSVLAFPVVKHASMAATALKKVKGKERNDPNPLEASVTDGHKKQVTDSARDATAKPTVLSPPSPSNHSSDVVVSKPVTTHEPPSMAISDVSESAFLPPSFPAQLQTSTPVPAKVPLDLPAREKPPPIPPQPQQLVSSPFPAPILSQANHSPTLRRQVSVVMPSSLPKPKRARPLTPPPDDMDKASSRLALLKTPPQPLKKARTMPAILNGPQPTTPPRSESPPSGFMKANNVLAPSTPQRRIPTLTELLASAGKVNMPRPTVDIVSDGSKNTQKKRRRRPLDEQDRFLMKTFVDASNPSHPLSSPLPDFTRNPAAFAPDVLSTQARLDGDQPEIIGSNVGTPMGDGSDLYEIGYNSQFDVEGQVDRVSELLERDVDFDGWLMDIHEGEDIPV